MRRPLFIFLIVLASLPVYALSSAEVLRQERFASPKGGFLVFFTEMEHRKYTKEEMLESLENVSNILYRVDFIPTGSADPLVSAGYSDVYGWNKGSAPSGIKDTFKKIVWSPFEDFVIMPREDWAGAPGTHESTLLALNPKLPWKKAAVSLENISWIDGLAFVGDYHNDCDYGVSGFDGRTGRMLSLKESESPIGYELVSAEGNLVTVRMVLDNCRMQDVPPRCVTHDLATGEEKDVACARARPGK